MLAAQTLALERNWSCDSNITTGETTHTSGKESEPETNRKSWSTLCPECSSFYAASLQNFIFSFQWLYTTIMWGNHLDPGFTYFISNILGLIFINNCPLAKQIYTSVYKQSYFRYWSWKILIVLGISVCCFFKNQITAMLFEIANIKWYFWTLLLLVTYFDFWHFKWALLPLLNLSQR